MWKVTLKNLLAHKGRLLRTGLAILLAVSFVSGTYVFTDTLDNLFNGMMTKATQGVDVYVRGESAFVKKMVSADDDRRPVPQSVLRDVRKVDGVAMAYPSVGGLAPLVDKNGDVIRNGLAPTIGFSYSPPPLSSIRIVDGTPPNSPADIAIDIGTAQENDFQIGDTIGVVVGGPTRDFKITGITKFGEENNMSGATMAVFDLLTAQTIYDMEDQFNTIEIAADEGIGQRELTERIASVLPKGTEAATGTAVTEESVRVFDTMVGFFETILLVFAAIALFVGAFLIFNTFGMLVAQRTKEFALVRSLGASPSQVTRSVLGEALLISIIASIVGIGLGIAVAQGLQRLLGTFGLDMPQGELQLLPRTIVVSFVLGVGITCIAALAPARRAGKVPPLAAMRDVTTESTGMRKRTVAGLATTITGTGLLGLGLFGSVSQELLWVGGGALSIFLGIAVLSPIIAGPIAALLAAPLPRLAGVSGRLARGNAMRNKKRTATTASALMIGVALVSFVGILSASIRATVSSGLEESLRADFAVTGADAFGIFGFDPKVAQNLALQPEIKAASPIRWGEWQQDRATKQLTAVDPLTLRLVIDIDLQEGSVIDLEQGGILIQDDAAESAGVTVGDKLAMRFARSGDKKLEVVGTYGDSGIVASDYLVSLDTYKRHFGVGRDMQVYIEGSTGLGAAEVRSAVERVTNAFPDVKVMDRDELRDSQQQQIDQMLGLITALLALAIIIAVIGIGNTLSLSILERKRELGLLRAVGMSRSQVRKMIRWEAILVALIGASLGLAIGVFFGWAVVSALKSEGVNELRLPGIQLAIYFVAAGFAGVLAALMPARRAARTDVLTAVASE